MYPLIIGVTGQKFNGKDTVADYLVANHGYTKLSLAGPLKQMCQVLFGFDDAQLYGDLKEVVDSRWNITPRRAMQFVGTEMVRDTITGLLPDIGEDFWVAVLINKIAEQSLYDRRRFVISDIRFENELKCLKNYKPKSKFIRVERSSIEVNPFSVHPSETAIMTLPVDFVIANDASLEELYTKVDALFVD